MASTPFAHIFNTRHMIKGINKLIIFALLFFAVTACSKEDDINEIFIDRSWTLSFIQEGADKFVPEKGDYIILFKNKTFTLTTPSSATINGNWQADGGSRSMRLSNIRTSGSLSEDNIGKKMFNMLQNTTSYSGDANWLQIIVQPGNAYMQFYNR